MKILADENVDFAIIRRLRDDGHTADSISELAKSSADNDVLALADQTGFVLLTDDKDFGELVYRLNQSHCGVVLSRLNHLSRATQIATIANAFRDHESEFLGAFTVLSPGKMRIRKSVNPDVP